MNTESSHDKFPRKSLRKAIMIFFDILVIGSVLVLPWLWSTEPNLSTIVKTWWAGRASENLGDWAAVDNAVLTAAGGAASSGNVAVSLRKLHKDNPDHSEFAQLMLSRGGYTLYPRRLWCAFEGTLLNGGPDLFDTPFNFSMEWLRAHDVQGVVEGTPDPAGRVLARVLVVPGTGDRK